MHNAQFLSILYQSYGSVDQVYIYIYIDDVRTYSIKKYAHYFKRIKKIYDPNTHAEGNNSRKLKLFNDSRSGLPLFHDESNSLHTYAYINYLLSRNRQPAHEYYDTISTCTHPIYSYVFGHTIEREHNVLERSSKNIQHPKETLEHRQMTICNIFSTPSHRVSRNTLLRNQTAPLLLLTRLKSGAPESSLCSIANIKQLDKTRFGTLRHAGAHYRLSRQRQSGGLYSTH